jgi:uncharacterized DUF497 family protein
MFEWDEAKNAANHRKHGIAFQDVLPIFGLAATDGLVLEDRRRNYGETRFILLCPFRGTLLHVTYTHRGENIRLISVRRASRKETQDHEHRNNRAGTPDPDRDRRN